MKTILVIVQHRKGRSPGQRFRIEHFLPYLEERNYNIVFSNYLDEKSDKIFYSKANYFRKLLIAIKAFRHRLRDLKIAKKSDVVFVYREAHMLGTTYIERKLSKMPAVFVFDFDDSIWLNDTSDGNKNLAWMKRTSKTADICKYADLVTTGNEYLADYARKYNENVLVIPTSIDINYHQRKESNNEKDKICIGWTGTSTTIKHFYSALPALKKIKEKYGDKVYFKLIANIDCIDVTEIDIDVVRWTLKNEIQDLKEFDIGIMPLPDDLWSKGKCGFKGLQCMAMEIPVIMSPVGVNTEIIEHGQNGFLANSKEEWIEYLSKLIEDKDLREKLGKSGRKTVEEKYSVNVVAPTFVDALEKALKPKL